MTRELANEGEPFALGELLEPRVEKRIDAGALSLGLLQKLARTRMRADRVVDERTGCRLPAFRQPHAGNHCGTIGSPNPRYESRFDGHCHVAARGAADQGE